MGAQWEDKKGPVIADTVYEGGTLVGKDVAFTLPGLEFMTTTIQAMGEMEIPLIGLLNNMELSITKIGVDKGLGSLSKLEPLDLEFRWVQDVVQSGGTVKPEGCKAFVHVLPSATPELEVEVGNATESEIKYNVTSMKIYADGVEYIYVDRLAGVLKVNGKDYYTDISNLL